MTYVTLTMNEAPSAADASSDIALPRTSHDCSGDFYVFKLLHAEDDMVSQLC